MHGDDLRLSFVHSYLLRIRTNITKTRFCQYEWTKKSKEPSKTALVEVGW